MTRPIPKCASCQSFPLTKAADGNGSATCEAWEEPRMWSDTAAACVLYNEVSPGERAGRARLVKRLADQQKEKDHNAK